MLDFELDGENYYGFITEVAEVILTVFCEYLGCTYEDCDELFEKEYSQLVRGMSASEDYRQLEKNMIKNGFGVWDMHAGNIGYMPDGRIVCIDFDNS